MEYLQQLYKKSSANQTAQGTGSHVPPGGPAAYRNSPAQGMGAYTSGNRNTPLRDPVGQTRHGLPASLYNLPVGQTRHFPGPGAYGADAAAKARDDELNRRRGELNTLPERLEAARLAARANAPVPSTTAALAGKPDVPGHWESPYSQDYLNQLGDRLSQAGGAAQQAFNAAKIDVANNYAMGTQQRHNTLEGVNADLQGNAANIGVDYADSAQAKQARTDRDFLTQMTDTNRASDMSTNDKLGVIANQFGSNLGAQAREGLLTPKTWVEGRDGLSGGDKLMADFLMNKYNQELGTRELDKRLAADAASQKATTGSFADMFKQTLDQNASEESKQNYPDLVRALGQIQDTGMRDEIDRVYGLSGDPEAAINYLYGDYLTENPNIFGNLQLPAITGGRNPASQAKALSNYTAAKAEQEEQQRRYQAIVEFFKNFSPDYTGTRTQIGTSNKSNIQYG
jgi:hypothetical protein